MADQWCTEIEDLTLTIDPFDEREAADRADAVRWIGSGEPLVRIRRPNVPHKHLVAYAIPLDSENGKLLLIDHRLSGLWLPPGGHVEQAESPTNCAIRELKEELGIDPLPHSNHQLPMFLTVQETIGSDPHIDVGFWFLISVDPTAPLTPDAREMRSVRWLTHDEILATRIGEMEPNMHRFVAKLHQANLL